MITEIMMTEIECSVNRTVRRIIPHWREGVLRGSWSQVSAGASPTALPEIRGRRYPRRTLFAQRQGNTSPFMEWAWRQTYAWVDRSLSRVGECRRGVLLRVG